MLKLFDYYINGNSTIKERIINDNIFSELVFDKVLDCIKDNNMEVAIMLIKKELLRIKMMLYYFDRGEYLNDIITQDSALEILIDYKKAIMKKQGLHLYKKMNYKDLNLSDRDITRISCMVVHPGLIGDDNYIKNCL